MNCSPHSCATLTLLNIRVAGSVHDQRTDLKHNQLLIGGISCKYLDKCPNEHTDVGNLVNLAMLLANDYLNVS